jgi:hypothetical protein
MVTAASIDAVHRGASRMRDTGKAANASEAMTDSSGPRNIAKGVSEVQPIRAGQCALQRPRHCPVARLAAIFAIPTPFPNGTTLDHWCQVNCTRFPLTHTFV